MTKKTNRVTFALNEKEYELKLTFDAINYMNSIEDGGALALIGKVMMGDLGVYTHIVYAGLLHTGEGISYNTVKAEINNKIEAGEIDLDKILHDGNALVANSFFFKKTVDKLMKNEDAKQAMDQLLN
ncbi:hypothetical protein MFLO_16110 [Listeria floridensis FSL S10-1187]|uniref:Phage protein n=1 Tax=Listeria floridensis FSL S10-1187 TaxID=1265817 RepID=A0ABN0RB23_9LIST|nr:tail assembly chaperone [Listeria floridensis]EUJ23260.1 hypothetical protein MFLO_16110 [Listeria floridensis FSL S10-1187]